MSWCLKILGSWQEANTVQADAGYFLALLYACLIPECSPAGAQEFPLPGRHSGQAESCACSRTWINSCKGDLMKRLDGGGLRTRFHPSKGRVIARPSDPVLFLPLKRSVSMCSRLRLAAPGHILELLPASLSLATAGTWRAAEISQALANPPSV